MDNAAYDHKGEIVIITTRGCNGHHAHPRRFSLDSVKSTLAATCPEKSLELDDPVLEDHDPLLYGIDDVPPWYSNFYNFMKI